MSNKIIYRREKGSQLTSSEVDGNFQYLDERIDKALQKDYFIHDSGYVKSGNQITINVGSRWLIGGVENSNAVPFIFDIERSEYGNFRVDVIVANGKGEFDVIKGVESKEGYSIPVIGNSLSYLYVYITDTGVQNIASEASGDYVSKLSYRWSSIDLRGKTLPIELNQRTIDIVGGNSFEGGIKNGLYGFELKSDFPDGFEISIRNNRTDYITVIHNAEVTIPIKLYTLENYYLRPKEIIKFKYSKEENCFSLTGALDIRLSSQNVDDIIGIDSMNMFIESSKGYLLMADDMNTTLTPTIQQYWKDLTYKAIDWQWYRESGPTQEDHDSDEIWALNKKTRILHLTPEDFTQNVYECSITFTCQAIVEGNEIKQSLKFN